MSTDKYTFTDRYQALGIPYPDPATMCKGPCEGIGRYPVFDERGLSPYEVVQRIRLNLAAPAEQHSVNDAQRWEHEHAEARNHECDGWHFVQCPHCYGSGKARP